jgi:hypothetical protein
MSFAAGVDRVRRSIVDVDGLHASHVFLFPGVITDDSMTLTFWRDDQAMRSFAYRPGVHKDEMDAFRLDETADRTSFTRLLPVWSRGTWWGRDPLAAP